jgi:CubicO group peptidase (beta-lactamase class C family)
MTPRIPDAVDLGLMAGPPPIPAERSVTLSNWQDPPFNRWGFQHVRELIPTARIGRGEGPFWRLPRAERDLSGLQIRAAGQEMALDRFLEDTYTDGLLVLHRGRIVTERYFNGMTPDTTHLCMSVSKSITSAVAGVLVGRRELDPAWSVTDVLPELAGTSFDGCTVRHLLDMRAGTRFNEDYADLHADVRVYEQVYLWRPRIDPGLPGSITDYYRTLQNQRSHGGPFDYRSILTDVLGWVIERAAGRRFAEIASRELWRPMGAEFDAEVTVDAYGNAMFDGGVCCTLRDLARFGELMLQDGRRQRRQVVPVEWIGDTLTPDHDTVAAFRALEDASLSRFPADGYYRNQWWVIDPTGAVYLGSGINGQSLLVHGAARVVVAKFSTWPVAFTDEMAEPTLTGLLDLADRISSGSATDRRLV